MARDYPKHFADVVNDRGHADTADVFIQCAMFAKAIYGCEAPKHSPYSPEAQDKLKRWIADMKKEMAQD